jgi:hypothetical protein
LDNRGDLLIGAINASSFTLNPDGSFVYVVEDDYAGKDSFAYVVDDGTLLSTEPAVVTVRILPEVG